MEPTLLYHITDYRNLPSILDNGGLAAHSRVSGNKISYTDIAHHSIQSRRSKISVSAAPRGMLHDYVPFYFSPRSPMLYAIHRKNVEGFSGTQDDIIYLVTSTDVIKDGGKDFVFTDGHAIMLWTEFYNELSHLDKIDWEVMDSIYWNDTDQDPDRTRRRQAEFLVHKFENRDKTNILFLGGEDIDLF
ncbi:DUF4433 domain-containing protein [Salicibibacter halophilus]|uniref:DUF4433 domain-containing protein n=1 Tax=Salicibibacter halophilus TaxID=2502791 RepID=A0A514LF12_9BACI|nr:DUF4433 domain-containing protein [Salicibibacter halophilus]QDI90444.1 DUF4433 domain-containing protein [Salicibibacter halophilus]